jgi:hypothetical protein
MIVVFLLLLSFHGRGQHAAPCKGPVSKAKFEAIRDEVTTTDYDDTRLEAAKKLIEGNCFTSEQVVRLCKLFIQDAARLKIAMYAYPRTVDPGNYAKVNVVFELDENKKALNDFINAK